MNHKIPKKIVIEKCKLCSKNILKMYKNSKTIEIFEADDNGYICYDCYIRTYKCDKCISENMPGCICRDSVRKKV